MIGPTILRAVAPVFVVVAEKLPRGVVLPIPPANVIAPVPDIKVRDCDPAVVPSIVPPKEIAPLLALVLITEDPAKVVGTAFVIVNELAVILLPIDTSLVPAVDEINRAPSCVVPPTIPVNVIVPVEPPFKVSP